MYQRISRFLRSSTAKSGYSFASSGLSFAAANLILAHNLSVPNYAVFALLVAIVMLAASVAMLGADGVVNRHPLKPDIALVLRVIVSAALVASAAAWLALRAYNIELDLIVILIPTITAFGISRFCGAYLQSRMQFVSSLLVYNSFNYLLLFIAILSIFFRFDNLAVPFAILAILQSMCAGAAIYLVRSRFLSTETSYKYSWREALAYLAMASCSEVLVQLERLVTARVLELRDLAVLGVLLALVGPPFRLVYLTFGYDLLPALRKARHHSRVRLLSRHLSLAFAAIVSLWVVIWFGAPLVQRAFLSEDYAMPDALILAALVAGTVKGFSGIAQASVTALADVRRMEMMAVIGWVSVFIGIGAAWYGARYGVAGVVYGVSVGWLLRTLAAVYIVAGQLQHDNTVAKESTGMAL